MNIYTFNNYRKALKFVYKDVKSIKRSISLESLAADISSHGSFLSNVFNEKAHINSDQLTSLCESLGLTEEQRMYLDLLLQWERSTHPSRRKSLQEEIEKRHQKKSRAKDSIGKVEDVLPEVGFLEAYYSNPYCKVIHIFLGIEEFAKQPSLILQHLPLSEEEFERIIRTLVDLKMIAKEQDKIVILRKNLHLPREASICRPHQILMRQISQIKYQSSSTDKLETLSVTFSADTSAYEDIYKEYLNFLGKAKKLVEDCKKPSDVYQINFDMFPW